jgi:phosphatidylserine synthase
MISMGIAPALFVYIMYQDVLSRSVYYHIILLFVLILFLSLGVIRLASFHIMKDKKFFIGFPASASTIIILVLAYFEINFLYILLITTVVSLAMICNVRFPKPDIKVNSIATILIILTIIFGKNIYGLAPLALFIAIIVYSIGGPIHSKFFEKKQ